MNKVYESPELEIVRYRLTADILTVSECEQGKSSGVIEEPDPEDVLLD